ncbi:uncharacterized protein JF76_07600 [Lactobacillus kullabergensis]|uniref:YqbQ/XkdQ domain-containing protein n=1 Tax=Lactobacillus kullabergensis TaxID=1218493 RepID=A0A0F4LBD1_9LACO|nr:hypothetical protein [Lactobacillus kullabergensis]KJY56152.1 uncharacterized protein JF76_07600 [Lactobacillus kullabergensis]
MITTFKLVRRSNLYRKSKKNGKGTTYDLRNVVANVKWSTDLNFSAGELTFDLIQKAHPIIPYTGDVIKFRWSHHKIFYGYVFNYKVKEDDTVSVTCYDKERYLKNQDSIVWKSGTIADRFNNVCKRAGIKHKVVDKPTHKVAAEVCDGKTYFDMLKSAITKTLSATKHMYYVYCNYDVVELRRAPYKKLKIIIGSKSAMTGFSYAVDINDTANVVKVIQKDVKKSQSKSATAKQKKANGKNQKTTSAKAKTSKKDEAKRTSFKSVSAKGDSTEQWGKLQITVNKKNKANHAQMVKQAKDELRKRNRANKELTVDCIGNVDLVAGNAVTIKINDINKTLKNCPILKAEHEFGTDYMCHLTMKVGASWLENG